MTRLRGLHGLRGAGTRFRFGITAAGAGAAALLMACGGCQVSARDLHMRSVGRVVYATPGDGSVRVFPTPREESGIAAGTGAPMAGVVGE